jgi:peptidoglycan hydrolase CwlO-like protein
MVHMKRPLHSTERITTWVGSVYSLVFHTVLFIGFFILAATKIFPWDTILLVLTTLVSLEAIYFSIFIQMTVNRHAESLREVEEDVGEIQENIDEIQEDVDEIQGDVEEMSEDLEEIVEDETSSVQSVSLETLAKDLQKVLHDLEQLKKGS